MSEIPVQQEKKMTKYITYSMTKNEIVHKAPHTLPHEQVQSILRDQPKPQGHPESQGHPELAHLKIPQRPQVQPQGHPALAHLQIPQRPQLPPHLTLQRVLPKTQASHGQLPRLLPKLPTTETAERVPLALLPLPNLKPKPVTASKPPDEAAPLQPLFKMPQLLPKPTPKDVPKSAADVNVDMVDQMQSLNLSSKAPAPPAQQPQLQLIQQEPLQQETQPQSPPQEQQEQEQHQQEQQQQELQQQEEQQQEQQQQELQQQEQQQQERQQQEQQQQERQPQEQQQQHQEQQSQPNPNILWIQPEILIKRSSCPLRQFLKHGRQNPKNSNVDFSLSPWRNREPSPPPTPRRIINVEVVEVLPDPPCYRTTPRMLPPLPRPDEAFIKEVAKMQRDQEEFEVLFKQLKSMLGAVGKRVLGLEKEPEMANNDLKRQREDGDSDKTTSSSTSTLYDPRFPYPVDMGNKGSKWVLGPHGTTLPADTFFKVFTSSESGIAHVRLLLNILFTPDDLATHTLSGRPSPAFFGRERPTKAMLDQKLVEDILTAVRTMSGEKTRHIRAAITTKCADSAKKLKRRLKKQEEKQAKPKKKFKLDVEVTEKEEPCSPVSLAVQAEQVPPTMRIPQATQVHVPQVRLFPQILQSVQSPKGVPQVVPAVKLPQTPQLHQYAKFPQTAQFCQVPQTAQFTQVPQATQLGQVPQAAHYGFLSSGSHILQSSRIPQISPFVLLPQATQKRR